MQRQKDWNSFKNILCIRPDKMGDILMTSPAIKALKKSVPGRKITLLTSTSGSSIAKYIPAIDEVIIFDTPWEKNPESGSSSVLRNIIEIIWKKKFDAAVIFTVYSQNPLPSAMLCYMAEIPRVAGYCRENPYKLITDWIPDEEPLFEIRHEVQRQLILAEHLGASAQDGSFSLKISEEASSGIIKKLKTYGINTHEKSVIIHPGVSELKRQYPVYDFAKIAKMIVDELGYQVILTGMKAEKNLTDAIQEVSRQKTYNLAGELNMEEFIALIKTSSLLISNNTGPVHIAAAVKTPVVVLYALTNPQHVPWNVPHKIFPFDIPKEMHSKNIIIRYAREKTFTKKAKTVSAEKIVMAAKELLKVTEKNATTKVLYL